MANIHVDGTLKASLTVGNIVGVTDKKLEEALSTKADINHIHEEYLTEHQDISHLAEKSEIPSIEGLASEEYVITQINAIPGVDLSNHVTNEQLTAVLETKANVKHNHDNEYVSQSQYEELSSTVESNSEKINDNEISIINNTRKLNTLAAQKLDPDTSYDSLLTNDKTIIGAINEIFEMVRSLMSYTITVNYIDIDGNVLQDPYIFTVKSDEEYNVDDEVVIDGYFYSHTKGETQGIAINNITIDIIYKANPSSEFYTEYRIDNETSPNDTLQSNGYLPTISEGMKVFALKTDGQYTDKLDTLVSEVDTIRVEYPEETNRFMFPLKLIELVSINITNFTSFNSMFAGCGLLVSLDVQDWDVSNIISFSYMFEECENLLSFNASNWNTSNVTSMNGMFDGCVSLEKLYLNNWDTSNVDVSNDKAEDMFYGVPILDDSHWGFDSGSYANFTLTEYQTGYKGIFPWTKEPESDLFSTTYTINPDSSSPALYSGDIKDETIFAYGSYMPKFDTGYTYVELLLNDDTITTNLDIPALEVQQATVWYSEETKDISFADTKVKDVTYINLENIESLTFTDCAYLESVDLSKTTTTGNCVHEGTFEGVPEECKINISKDWETTEEQSGFTGIYIDPWTYHTKYVVTHITAPISSSYDAIIPKVGSEITDLEIKNPLEFREIEIHMRDGNILDGKDIENISEELLVSDIELIIAYYPEETTVIRYPLCIRELLYINIEKFTSFDAMFFGCSDLENIEGIDYWYTGNITSMGGTFYECSSLTTLDLSQWDTSSVTDTNYMFYNCSSLTSLYLTGWSTENVKNMFGMFEGCSSLTELDLSSFNFNNVNSVEHLFSNCNSLKRINLYNSDTSNLEFNNVYSLESMFYGCTSLEDIAGLAFFDTSNIENMINMFEGCISLHTIDTPWITPNLRYATSMFANCTSLETLNLFNWDTSSVLNTVGMFRNCTSLTSLNLSSFDTRNITDMYGMFNKISSDIDWFYNPEEPNSYANFTLTEEETGFSGTFPWNIQEENPYYIEYTISGDDLVTYEELFYPIIEHVDYIIAYGHSGVVFDSRKDNLSDENKPSNIVVIRGYYHAGTQRLSFSGNNYINGVNYCRVPVNCGLTSMFYACGRIEYLNLSNWEFDDIHSINNMNQMFHDSPIRYLNLMNWELIPDGLEELTDCFITAGHGYENVNVPSYHTFVDYIPTQDSKYDYNPVGTILSPVKDLTGEGYTTEVILNNGDIMTLSDAINQEILYGEIHFIRQYYDPTQYEDYKLNPIFGDNYGHVESILYLDTKNVTELHSYFYFVLTSHIKYITPVLDFSNVQVMESLVGGTIPEGLVINIANSKPNEAIHGSNLLLCNANKDSMGTLILPAGVFDLSKMINTPNVNIIEVE